MKLVIIIQIPINTRVNMRALLLKKKKELFINKVCVHTELDSLAYVR
jgi:hypothetical protein